MAKRTSPLKARILDAYDSGQHKLHRDVAKAAGASVDYTYRVLRKNRPGKPRKPPGYTAGERCRKLYKADPSMTCTEIAERVGCTAIYARSTTKALREERNGKPEKPPASELIIQAWNGMTGDKKPSTRYIADFIGCSQTHVWRVLAANRHKLTVPYPDHAAEVRAKVRHAVEDLMIDDKFAPTAVDIAGRYSMSIGAANKVRRQVIEKGLPTSRDYQLLESIRRVEEVLHRNPAISIKDLMAEAKCSQETAQKVLRRPEIKERRQSAMESPGCLATTSRKRPNQVRKDETERQIKRIVDAVLDSDDELIPRIADLMETHNCSRPTAGKAVKILRDEHGMNQQSRAKPIKPPQNMGRESYGPETLNARDLLTRAWV